MHGKRCCGPTGSRHRDRPPAEAAHRRRDHHRFHRYPADQLQLLEHFTTAVRDDAGPQIAQLTELGLVELTRKRQGQNIYELFGRACPSCGLGHVAVLPGKICSSLATATGLVRSAASARAQVAAPVETAANGRRRRGGRGRAAQDNLPVLSDTDGTEAPEVSTQEAQEPALARRQDPELVAVPMTLEQEEVYGTFGLNPILLLDEPRESENVMVRVVRPGEDAEAVLEQARQQLAATAGRRRRRGGRGGRGASRGNGGTSSSTSLETPAVAEAERPAVVEEQPLMVEITPLEAVQTVVLDEVAPTPTPTSTSMPDAVVDAPKAVDEDPDPEEPRRRRRRSSAGSSPG